MAKKNSESLPIDAQPPAVRVKVGKKDEDNVVKCLNKHYDWKLEKATFKEDTCQKTDCFQVNESGDRLPVQIKTRVTGDDFLVSLYEPYYGIDDSRTEIGRDVKQKYYCYVCLSKDRKTIRVVKGTLLKKIVNSLIKQWKTKGCPLPHSFKNTCEFRWHRDRWSGKPKVLCFIPPDVFKKSKKEIQLFKMKK